MPKVFAPNYERDSHNWVLFPLNDSKDRNDIFPVETNKHPAKANLYLIQSVIEYVSEPGDTLMDIMAGSGTTMVGALTGRNIICIELNKDEYFPLLEMSRAAVEKLAPGCSIITINAACQAVLPIPCNHIIFSPPYAQIMKSKGTDKLTMEKSGAYKMAAYSEDPQNVGQVNEFIYHHMMEGIYKKCYQSLPVGGTLTLLLKDHMHNRQRVEISARAAKDCVGIGFELKDWFKWFTLGSMYTRIYRARGWETVDEEDIIILRRTK